MSTCNWLDLETLGSRLTMPKNLPRHTLGRKTWSGQSKDCEKWELWKSWIARNGDQLWITIFVNLGLFWHFETVPKYKNMDKITQVLENVVRCKYFEAGVRIKNPIKNSYQDGLGRTTQTLDHVVVVQILIWDKRKSQSNKYSEIHSCCAKYRRRAFF